MRILEFTIECHNPKDPLKSFQANKSLTYGTAPYTWKCFKLENYCSLRSINCLQSNQANETLK